MGAYDSIEKIEARLRELDQEAPSDWGANHRKWLHKQKRSVRLKLARERGTHTRLEWYRLVIEFGGRCVKCCDDLQGWVDRDHIIPLMAGGSDSIDNIQPLCRNCNAAKSQDTTNWVAIRRKHGWPFKKDKAA